MQIITPGTNAYLIAAKSLVRQGVLTADQYLEMERRNSRLPKESRQTMIELR